MCEVMATANGLILTGNEVYITHYNYVVNTTHYKESFIDMHMLQLQLLFDNFYASRTVHIRISTYICT